MGGLEGGVLRGEEVRTYAEGNFEQKVTYPIVHLGKILYIGTCGMIQCAGSGPGFWQRYPRGYWVGGVQILVYTGLAS